MNKFSINFLSLIIFLISYFEAFSFPNQIIDHGRRLRNKSFEDKLLLYAKFFKGIPYGPPEYLVKDDIEDFEELFEEISKSEFLYTFDKLDCVTLIETVIALSQIDEFTNKKEFVSKFEFNLKNIRYYKGIDQYLFRNHFTSTDWIRNNSSICNDITTDIYEQSKIAECIIKRFNWLLGYIPIKNYLKKLDVDKTNEFKVLFKDKLTRIGYNIYDQVSKIPYIPLSFFLKNYSNLISKFPKCGIINIVRPNWNLENIIGTNLNISHQGLFFKDKNRIIFIHSTSKLNNGVVEIDLKKYLESMVKIKTIKGINILQIH